MSEEKNTTIPGAGEFVTYTINETAKILRVSRRTIFTYLKDGKLHGFKVGRTVRIKPDELRRFMNELENGSE